MNGEDEELVRVIFHVPRNEHGHATVMEPGRPVLLHNTELHVPTEEPFSIHPIRLEAIRGKDGKAMRWLHTVDDCIEQKCADQQLVEEALALAKAAAPAAAEPSENPPPSTDEPTAEQIEEETAPQ